MTENLQRLRRMVLLIAIALMGLMAIQSTTAAAPPAQDGATEIYLVRLQAPPLAGYTGGIDGLEATSRAVTNSKVSHFDNPASLAYIDFLAGERAAALDAIVNAIGRSDVEVVYEYYAANNGFAIMLSASEAATVATLPEVNFIQKDFERELETDNGPEFIGATHIWDGSGTGGLPGTMGEGVVAAVIDTGLNHDSPSFANPGPVDGFVHTNPLGTGNFLGQCDAYPGYCNDKLIGTHSYASVSVDPEDTDGHGSHTASTTAGNFVQATVAGPTGATMTADISGVAPHANVIGYNACCTLSALSAAIDDTIIDYNDILAVSPDWKMVINYSIGSTSPSNIWNDFDTIGYLNARAEGIFVATSAGNSGPGPNTVGSPGDAPWITTVGSSSHNRFIRNDLVNLTGGSSAPPADLIGKGLATGYGPAPLVYAGDYGNPLCLEGIWAANTFTNEIVVCDRGQIARVAKGANVEAAGGDGFVLANNESTAETLNGDAHVIPGVHISYADGEALKTWMASGTGHTGTISGFSVSVDPAFGDELSYFSSRGQNRALPDIISPSVTAPGLDILAAYEDQVGPTTEFNVISGTSMASPHTAGAAALIMALHPDWTPAEVQSALMLTANTNIVLEDGVTPGNPFDIGNGRIQADLAAQSPLVLDETIENYQGANPVVGALEVLALNLPSLGNDECGNGTCGWFRTVRATVDGTWTASQAPDAPANVTVTVSPATFSLNAGETQVLTIAVATDEPVGSGVWDFGGVSITGTGPDMYMPIAVKSVEGPTAVTTGDFDASGGSTMPLALFGLTMAAMAGLALWRRRA